MTVKAVKTIDFSKLQCPLAHLEEYCLAMGHQQESLPGTWGKPYKASSEAQLGLSLLHVTCSMLASNEELNATQRTAAEVSIILV